MDVAESDPYWKLRPTPPTPVEEICDCPPGHRLILVYKLRDNPLDCLECRGEVPPERLALSGELADRIARWRDAYGALYDLWLDSGEYEDWARERLLDPQGQVNRDGIEIAAELNRLIPTFYWWFTDTGVDDYQPPRHCPICHGALETLEHCSIQGIQVCDDCRILI